MRLRSAWLYVALVAILIVGTLAAIALGSVALTPADVIAALTGHASEDVTAIVVGLRLPRVALAALVGVALGASGATLQATLRNPLAEPYLLGVSGGAAVGAVIAMSLRLPAAFWPILAFAGAAVAVMAALAVARGASGGGSIDIRILLMAGVVVGAFANAVIMIVLANVPPNTVRGALWWMMGSVADSDVGRSRLARHLHDCCRRVPRV